jgi:hypothetical protein
VKLEEKRPHCGHNLGIDYGTCRPGDLADKIVNCSACGEPYQRMVDWGAVLNFMIRTKTLTFDTNGPLNADPGQTNQNDPVGGNSPS